MSPKGVAKKPVAAAESGVVKDSLAELLHYESPWVASLFNHHITIIITIITIITIIITIIIIIITIIIIAIVFMIILTIIAIIIVIIISGAQWEVVLGCDRA
jgi:hypothetical protein